MNRETCRDVPELAGVGTVELQQGLQEYGQILKQPCCPDSLVPARWSRLTGTGPADHTAGLLVRL